MPYCGLFHDFELTDEGNGSYLLGLALEGHADVKRLFEDCGLASRVDHLELSVSSRYSTEIRLSGVVDYRGLEVFCNYSRSTIIIDLPYVDHCFALGPYTLSSNGSLLHSEIGDLVNRAKYQKDQEALDNLLNRLWEFIDSNPILEGSTAVVVPPKSIPGLFDLPMAWAKTIAREFGWYLVDPRKTKETEPQKNYEKIENEHDAVARIQDSMVVEQLPPSSRGRMLDDTIGSGGTLTELARVAAAGGRRERLRAICREGR